MDHPLRHESGTADTAALAKPLHFAFAGRDAPNRFLKGAMTERLSSWDPVNLEARGIPSEGLQRAYKVWGEGGIGTIITGNIMLAYDQVAAAGDPVIPKSVPKDDERFKGFQEMAKIGKVHGSIMIGQLNHPGRQVDRKIQPFPISASNVQQEGEVLGFMAAKPRPATIQDIDDVVESFASAASYLEDAGFDGVELHAAHGYLLSQFLSLKTNQRTDQYGGTLVNRARMIIEIARATRARTRPSFILGIKLNSVDFQDANFRSKDAKQLCRLLEDNRFDFVELSGGGLEHFNHARESTRKREGFFLDFADMITPSLKSTKVYVTGGFKSAGAMSRALSKVDGIGLARPLCQETDLCEQILEGKVQGAIQQRPDETNYGLTNVVAGSQIRRIAAGGGPIDLSTEENEQAFMQAMARWTEDKSKDADMVTFGYVDLSNVFPI